MRHRADIDGLRAVAVVPIVLFHAGISSIAGGFIGVDIFFVISGYLITSIILRDMEAKRFSFLDFYRRRMLRIFPALFVMLAVVLLVGMATMLPTELRPLGRSAAAAAGFASNIFFFNAVDYFAAPAAFKPLLHTWSLGVEEQFYIVFPLLLLALVKIRRLPLRLGLAALGIASFVTGYVLAGDHSAAAFYMLYSRAWELIIGSLVAVGMAPRLGGPLRGIAGWIGIALIAVGYAVITSKGLIAHPELMLLPTVGTALVIAYGENTLLARILSLPPVAAIGRMSYSLYLWHWPLIVFYRLNIEKHLAATDIAILVVASFVLAALSRQFVELPFLRMRNSARSGTVVLTGLGALAAMVAAGFVVTWNADGWRNLPPDVLLIASYDDYFSLPDYKAQYQRRACVALPSGPPLDRRICPAPDPAKPTFVLVGDSHAAQYGPAMMARFTDANVIAATSHGCEPVLPTAGAKRCTDIVDYVLGPLIREQKIDTVILAARWRPSDVPKLAGTIAAVKPFVRRVVVIGPTVEYDGSVPLLLANAMLKGKPETVQDVVTEERWKMDATIGKIARDAGAWYVPVLGIECPDGKCRTAVDGLPMQFDYGHLTLAGARYVVDRMDFGPEVLPSTAALPPKSD